jgi:hypothetical protein
MQIPFISGIWSDRRDLRTSYPVNLLVTPKESGVSTGYLRQAEGLTSTATVNTDRGGIEWQDEHYRVQGTKLVKISADGATVTVIGDVGGSGQVVMDYSFDRLAIASSGALWYWTGSLLTQVTDTDLGNVVDFVWIGGYFFTTDGQNLIVTELNNPGAVNPLKYGSAEIDPDPIVAVLRLRNEVYAVGTHTIEVFTNVGGDLFPFARIDGAQIQKGAISTHACCVCSDQIAFVGSGRNESIGVYLGASAQTTKISTKEIDTILEAADLSDILLESRADGSHEYLYIHLPDRTLLFDVGASKAMSAPVWSVLTGSRTGYEAYKARNIVRAHGKWWVGYNTNFGYLNDAIATHWGSHVRWEFGTSILYNNAKSAIIKSIELVTANQDENSTAFVSSSYSVDGAKWSQDRYKTARKRIVWLSQGTIRRWRVQRFQGDSTAKLSILALEMDVEALSV